MKIRTAIVACVLLLASLSAFAQNGGLKGVVLDRMGSRPVKDAKVSLLNMGKEIFVYTGEDGKFEITGLEDGMYSVEISAAGFYKTQVNVRVKAVYMT